mgnify:CR=1 FL=1
MTEEQTLYDAHLYMDFKNPEMAKVTVQRRADSKLDMKKGLENRLNPGKGKTIVSIVDVDGTLHMIHTMKLGRVVVEEADQ